MFFESIQSCKHAKASTVSGFSELREGVITFFPILNADSEATKETGMVRRSQAIFARSG
jgi:hypothetical protein